MAVTLGDLFWRRFGTGWSECHGLDAAQAAVQIMGPLKNWTPIQMQEQIALYQKDLEQTRVA